MATDLEKLVVQLSADIKGYERALARANGTTNKQFNAIERRARQLNSNLNSIGRSAAQSLIAPLSGIGAALGAREILSYSDAWTEAGNKIRAAATSAGVQARSLNSLKDGANEARTALSDYVDLYARLIRSASGVAKSEQEISNATMIVSKAFKAGGASASEQAAGILQLGQALGSGVLQGDELRSLRENAPILAKAIADEFKTTIAGLKDLGAEGKLTSDRVFKAILNAQKPIEAQFAATNATIKDSLTQINNEFLAYIGNADTSAGASRGLVEALQSLAENFKGVADVVVQFATIIISALTGRAILGMVAGLGNAVVALGAFLTAMRTGTLVATGFTAALGPIGLLAGAAAAAIYLFYNSQRDANGSAETFSKAIAANEGALKRAAGASREFSSALREQIALQAQAARAAATQADADFNAALGRRNAFRSMTGGYDFAPLKYATDEAAAKADALGFAAAKLEEQLGQLDKIKPGSDGFGGGLNTPPAADSKGGSSSKERANELERELKSITDRTAALVAETEAQRQVNPLIDDYGYAVEKARVQQDLLNAAQEAGVAITPQLRAEIASAAEQFALATAEAGRLAQSQDLIRQKAEDMADFQKDLSRGIVDGFIEGKKAADIFSEALSKIGNKLLDMAFDGLFNTSAQGGSGFNLLSLFGIGARASGGPVKKGEPYIVGEKRAELFVPNQSGTIIPKVPTAPNMPRLSSGSNGGGGTQVSYAPVINFQGTSEELAQLKDMMRKQEQNFSAKVVSTVRQAQKTRNL